MNLTDKNEMNKNMSYDYLVEAGHVNGVIRRLTLFHKPGDDKVKNMMHSYMIKTLEELRDSLTAQGLNGLKNDKVNWEQSSSNTNP